MAQYPFLMHALLALGAQHLAISTPTATTYSLPALHHRVAAITSLNAALSTPSVSRAAGDATLAAAIALTFQSTHMPEGMMDFLGMLRGWSVVQTTVVPEMEGSVFRGFTEGGFVESLRATVGEQGDGGSGVGGVVDGGLAERMQEVEVSLGLVGGLCGEDAERGYLGELERIVGVATGRGAVEGEFFILLFGHC